MSPVTAAAPADPRAKATSQPGFSRSGASSAKFLPPALPRHWVRRDRLNRLLAAASGQAMTVVTGPPGAGKSVLLADSASTPEVGRVSWVSLDPSDNDCCNFWTSIAIALGVDPETVAGMPDTWRFQTGEEQAREVAEAAPTGVPALLVLDDIHHLTDGSRLEGVTHLAHHLPPGIRLVAVGHDLSHSQQRWGRDGAVTLGEEDLRFTVAESSALLTLLTGRLLPAELVAALTDRTRGWGAGIYRAGTDLASRTDRSEALPRSSRGSGQPDHRHHLCSEVHHRADFHALVQHCDVLGGSPAESTAVSCMAHPVSDWGQPVSTGSGSYRRLYEPLTDRERELLGYLPSHLHLREIAARMYVSVNTVKTHLRNLYRKLGAGNRGEAVDIASSNGLL